MADVTRRIGLSLGADLCWPICYEEVLRRLDLALPIDGDVVRFETDRVIIEPFDLRQPTKYDLVVDRLTHWYTTSREWIKKAILTDGLYVFNNPWAIQSMEKHTSYCAMIRLGMPIPATAMVPPKQYEPKADLQVTLERYARLFDLGEVGTTSASRSSSSPTTAAVGRAFAASTTRPNCTARTTRVARTCCICNMPSTHTTCSSAASASVRRPD